jgi:hypothetical protein
MCRSKCFERFLAHHQEFTTALTASGFTLERGGSRTVGRCLADHDQQRCYHHAPKVIITIYLYNNILTKPH